MQRSVPSALAMALISFSATGVVAQPARDPTPATGAPPIVTILPPPANWQAGFNLAEARRKALEARVKKLEARLLSAERLLDRLDAANVDRAQADHNAVVLKPGERGYSTLDVGVGRITIAIDAVKAIEGGARITLQLGNPTTANLSAIRARIQYGENDPPDDSPRDDVRTASFRPATGVPASSWRSFDVDLKGLTPAQIGWVRISDLNVDSISLMKAMPPR